MRDITPKAKFTKDFIWNEEIWMARDEWKRANREFNASSGPGIPSLDGRPRNRF
jgi:hypothetical protein